MRLALLVSIVTVAGCEVPWTEGEIDGLRTLSAVSRTGRDGMATFVLETTEAEASLLATVQAESPFQGFVHSLTDPGGDVVFDAEALWEEPRNFTSAAFPDRVTSLNWPVDADQMLTPGPWTVEVGVLDAELFYVRDADVTVDVALKGDSGVGDGDLAVEIVYVGDVIGDAEVIDAVEGGVEIWRELYDGMGITIDVEYWEYDAVSDLPAPGYGAASDYVSIAASTSFRSVKVLIVSSIRDNGNLYGMAGGIPGPLVATGHTGVTISAATNAGPDLAFDAEEVRLLGETMAHEAAHFTGLFHPVEATYASWDYVDDTPECDGEDSCIRALGSNLMFPYPVCDDLTCAPQDGLTSGQAEISNRYTGTR